MNRKADFFYKTNRFESIRITNRIESIRIANWNALLVVHDDPVAAISSGGVRGGAESPAGSRSRAPGQGVRGRSPPEAEKKLNFDNTKPL